MAKTQKPMKKPKAYNFLKNGAISDGTTSHSMYNALLNMKPHQLVIMKHALKQELGHTLTHFHPKYPSIELSDAHKKLLSRHRVTENFDSGVQLAELYRKHHEKGGSLASAVTTGLKKTVDVLKKVGKKALQYGKKGAEYLMKHPEVIPKIIEGVATAVQIVGNLKKKPEEEKIDFKDDPFTTDDDDEKTGGGIKAGGGVAPGRFCL
jgi:hypothetical protein